jgi:hypothetical protein
MHEGMMRNASVREDDYSYVPLSFDEFLLPEEEVVQRLIAEEHERPFLSSRLKFVRALVQVVAQMIKPKCAGYAKAPEVIAFATHQLAEMSDTFGASSVPDSAFQQHIYLRKVSNFPPKKITGEYTSTDATNCFQATLDGLSNILTAKTQYTSFEALIAKVGQFSNANNLVRILCEMNLFDVREDESFWVFSTVNFRTLIMQTLQAAGF